MWKIFKYCQDAFRRGGINVAFPKGTDPEKTYKWRYLVNFAEKISEFEASDEAISRIIDAIVEYAIKHKQLHKGLTLLANDRVLELCTKNAAAVNNRQSELINRLKSDATLFNNEDPMYKVGLHGLPNIVKWYMQGVITRTYLAVSRRAHESMLKLSQVERSMMPKHDELVRIRSSIASDHRLKSNILVALGNDFRMDAR